MDASRSKGPEDFLFERANTQDGLLHRDDLTEAGLRRGAVDARLASRRLTRMQHDVFAFGHTALRIEAYWRAAMWACADSVLSHWSAAEYHGWPVERPDDDTGVHVTTKRTARSREAITVHRSRHLEEVDVFSAGPFRVTHIPRTFVDLADVLEWPAYRALADAQRSLPVAEIRAAQRRAPGRAGAPLVTRLIEADDAHTKSEFERRFLRFVSRQRLPRPIGVNVPVAGHTADCHYPAERLVIELDGRGFHARRAQMRADRQRDIDYQLAGQRIMRLVWDDLHPDEAPRTAARLRRLLAITRP